MQLAGHYNQRRFDSMSEGKARFVKVEQEKITNVTTVGGRDMCSSKTGLVG
jgi:hypothetical protein